MTHPYLKINKIRKKRLIKKAIIGNIWEGILLLLKYIINIVKRNFNKSCHGKLFQIEYIKVIFNR